MVLMVITPLIFGLIHHITFMEQCQYKSYTK